MRLSPDCSLKLLEEPCVFNRATDELYIVNHEALSFLADCAAGREEPGSARCGNATAAGEAVDGARPGDERDEFIRYCRKEKILTGAEGMPVRHLRLAESPRPSLRYLLLHVTARCNLSCRHCFLGEQKSQELTASEIDSALDQFEEMQGLRVMISGGEPLLHREFAMINELVGRRDLRSILLTNGTLIDGKTAATLRFQEVQVSLDGMRDGHDWLRGAGSFDRALEGIRHVREAGLGISVATMVHGHNLHEFDALEELVSGLGALQWSIDLPSPAGRMLAAGEEPVGPQAAGPLLGRAYGGAIHEPAPGYACGAHLMAVMPDGTLAPCGFYADQPIGDLEEGLAEAWARKPKITLEQLACDCEFIEECRGGCRFRAGGYKPEKRQRDWARQGGSLEPDAWQCHRYGISCKEVTR